MTDRSSRSRIDGLLARVSAETDGLRRPLRVMEVCGTHTMALFRSGLSPRLLDAGVEMISGPGCPVCITPDALHEEAIGLVTSRENLTLATFGDMTRVPTRRGSLQKAVPADGSRVRVVYSPLEALDEALAEPGREVVFFGVGFETTIPSIAHVIKKAAEAGLRNFSVLPALWLVPPALRAILEARDLRLDGFIYPGHVSAVIGTAPYAFAAEEFRMPGAVAGFEPEDILLAVLSVVEQIKTGRPRVALEYGRAVRPEGNPTALALMAEVLEPFDAVWRGLGRIPASGLLPRPAYAGWNALEKFGLRAPAADRPPAGCRCGDVLKGVLRPESCPLFGKKCGPESPLGPCMVSYEGACLIHFKFSNAGRKGT